MSQKISEKIGVLTSMFSANSPSKQHENAEFYKNKYIEELEHRVQINEKLAQKDELISKLLTRIKELEQRNVAADTSVSQSEEDKSEYAKSEESEELMVQANTPKTSKRESPKVAKKAVSPGPTQATVAVKQAHTLQKRMQQESPKESHLSAKKVQEQEQVYTELDGDPLVGWNDVIKESHPGSLGQMSAVAKQRLEASFTEFLIEHIPEEKVKKCRVLNQKNNAVVALPERLIEAFGEWLDIKIEQGMLDRGPLAKWKDEQAKIFGKAASPKRRESGKVQVDKTVSKKKATKENQGWIPWVDLVGKKFPDLNLNLPQFVLFVKAFVLSNELEEKKVNVPGVDVKVLSIPEEMSNSFLETFTEKFKYMKIVQAVIEKEGRGEKRDALHLDDSSNQPRKIVKSDAKQTAINDSGLDLYNKVLESIMPTYPNASREFRLEFKNRSKEWLINKVGGLEPFKENCALRYVYGNQARSTFGIPPPLKKGFTDWASVELKKSFGDAVVI